MVGGWGGRNVPPARPQPTVSLLPFHQPGSQHVRHPCPHSRWVFPFQITLSGNIPANSLGNSKLVEQMTVKMDHLASRCKVFKLSSSPLWWERGRVIFFFCPKHLNVLIFTCLVLKAPSPASLLGPVGKRAERAENLLSLNVRALGERSIRPSPIVGNNVIIT